jgi:hypothetical protein
MWKLAKFPLLLIGAVSALLLVPLILLRGVDMYVSWKQERYYQNHSLLKAFLAAAKNPNGSVSTSGPGPRLALLAYVAPGALAGDIIPRLGTEGFDCREVNVKSQPPSIVCSVSQDAMSYSVPRWHITMTLDEKRQLSDANVVMLK